MRAFGLNRIHRRELLIGGAALSLAAPSLSSPLTSMPTDELDEKQLGQLAFVDALARQMPSDWSHMGSAEPGQGGFDAYRYQLAMMSYALALAHYHYTPAWRERHHETSRLLLDKMMQFDVWDYWEQTSRGGRNTDPDLTQLNEGWIDPVRFKNIMYSGHLFQMVTAHDMLFGKREYDRPGSIFFDYNPVARGLGRQTFSYDVHTLAEVLVDQFRINGWRGIECEPNAVFPECNQHPLLGLKLYDAAHGSDHFSFVSRRFQERFRQLGYLGSDSSFMAFFMVKQSRMIPGADAWSDGWTNTFLHGWNESIPEATYPAQRARYLRTLPDGTATIAQPSRPSAYSHGHGFMATMAAELGDTATRDALLSYADRYWRPRWEGAAFLYPRFDDYKLPADGPDVWRRVQPLTANGLLILARIGGRNRLRDVFAAPFGAKHFYEPMLIGIDYPRVQVSRARYDGDSDTLAFRLSEGRGGQQASATTFTIANIDPRKPRTLYANGRVVGKCGDGFFNIGDAMVAGAGFTEAGLRLAVRLGGAASFSLRPTSA